MSKICKFGGTSCADASAFRQVKNIIEADPARKYVVVSAPGKRNKDDAKVTDLLYRCAAELKATGSIKENFQKIRERFIGIAEELNLNVDIKAILDKTEQEIVVNNSSDFTASRGEYLSAILMADYLGFEFIDAEDIISFDSKGRLNEEFTNDKTARRLSDVEKAVIPGFYGKDFEGKIKTFSRGGSDITGSIIARALNATLYENWTDVSGFLVCDPRIVPEAKTISKLTYKELRELSYMGAAVLHPEAIFPVMKGRITINIKNTFAPEDQGTFIVPNDDYKLNENSIITGIAGKKDFTVLFIEKSMMNAEVGFIRKVLSIIEHFGLCVEHLPSGIDTLSIVIESEQLRDGVLSNIVNEIRYTVNPDYIRVIENISLVAAVGHGMAGRPGVAANLFSALSKDNINIKMIDQGSSELNIIIGVDNADYEKCIKAIYNAFV